MPTELFHRIVEQLTLFRRTLKGVSLTHYNEPTLDRRLIDQLQTFHRNKIAVALLTNGVRLTPDLADRIKRVGLLKHLAVNLPTLDPVRYRSQCRTNHLDQVIQNLNYLARSRIAEQMEIVVLGTGDANHHADMAAVENRFSNTNFVVKFYPVMNRAGNVGVGIKPAEPNRRLGGCDQTGSRPLQWIHITAIGECVLCCQDYENRYVVGDLNRQSMAAVLGGSRIARLRRWAYGIEKAPPDFLCHGCIYALRR